MNKKKKCAKRRIIKQQILNIGWNLCENSTQDSSLPQANNQNARTNREPKAWVSTFSLSIQC